MLFRKNKHDSATESKSEYIELKKTIGSLQEIAADLKNTASDFKDRLEKLKTLNLASPNYRGE